jgi:hypothetical protein
MKVKNIKTGVVKELKNEFEVSMYLSTNEWVLVKEEPKKTNNSFKKNED